MTYISWVRWSPDGRWLALAGSTAEWGAAVFLMDSGGSARHVVSHEAGPLAWNGDGSALYILNNSRIVRQEIHRRTATPRDSGETVLSGLTDATSLSLARDVHLLVLDRGSSTSRNVAMTVPPFGNATGSEALPVSSSTGGIGAPAVSPDGRWVAWSERAGPAWSVLLAPFASGTPRTIARYESAWHTSLRWAPDSRRFAYFVGDSSPYDLYTATTDGAPPTRVAALQTGFAVFRGDTWIWARQGLIVPDSGLRGYMLVDPSLGRELPLASSDSLTRLYSPLLSPDGRILIAARWRPWGFANELWHLRLGTGAWERVPSNHTADPTLMRWDNSGIYAAFYFFARLHGGYEIWRAAALGAPFTPVLTGLRWCTGSEPSLSDDNRHLACTQTTIASDIWLVSGFDATAR